MDKEIKLPKETIEQHKNISEKEWIEYLISCCENILGKQVKGVGYPKAQEEYGLTSPVLQLIKMNHELKVRLEVLNAPK